MRFDMNEVLGERRKTNEDGPTWLSADDAMCLAIRDVSVDFWHVPGGDDLDADERLVARLDGMLVLGDEIDGAGEDFWQVCDGYNAELGAIAEIARSEGVLETAIGSSRTVLFIRQLDLAREIIDAENFMEFFDLIPKASFLLYNVHPDLLCYLVADREGYYDEAAASALLDPRSVDGYSPLIYAECGFTLDKTGEMLYKLLGY